MGWARTHSSICDENPDRYMDEVLLMCVQRYVVSVMCKCMCKCVSDKKSLSILSSENAMDAMDACYSHG